MENYSPEKPVGELLQHLKTLNDLNPGFPARNLPKTIDLVDTSASLVVRDISESLESLTSSPTEERRFLRR